MSFKTQARKIFSSTSSAPLKETKSSSINVAFVCTANVCRSAYAHHGLQYLANQSPKLQSMDIEVSSAGVLALVGEPMEHRILDIFNEKYQDYEVNHVARQLNESYCSSQDLILVMTTDHRRILLRENPSMLPKVFLFSEFVNLVEVIPGRDISGLGINNLVQKAHQARGQGVNADDIDDPYRRSEDIYRRVCNEIDNLLIKLANVLNKI